MRRILDLAGWQVKLGAPGDDDWVGVWGQSPTSPRGEAVAARTDAPLLRVEDAFLRSLHPGREGEPPLGLLLDKTGVHFDASAPSDLETLLATHPLDDTALLDRARAAIDRIRHAHLSKYAAVDPALSVPDPGYVVVIDQTEGDAAVRASGADAATFRDMLVCAQVENPASTILIKTHPETRAGHRPGYFDQDDLSDRIRFLDAEVSPWTLFDGAVGVYTVSSGLGFEAIFAGHKPRVFGQPFYAGWGLTDDRMPVARRDRNLTRAQLFAVAMILYPTWYDPYRDRLCQLEDVISTLEAQARAWRDDRHGWVADNMRLWKRRHIQQFFGREKPVKFSARNPGKRRRMAWASLGNSEPDLVRVEDGFIRSKGLGARLIPPVSLAVDDLGIYYDPSRESCLERLIAESGALPVAEIERAERLVGRICAAGLTKYNIAGAIPSDLPDGQRILVPGQVEDDASIIRGAAKIITNAELLAFTRAQNPHAVIIYKPHPDVEAGLRAGRVDEDVVMSQANFIARHADTNALLEQIDEVWTITSLTGFEALLRGVPVVCTGTPFYAGWGLTRDLGPTPARRTVTPTMAGLAHAALIGYPRYRDPVTGLPCPPEVVVDRMVMGQMPAPRGTGRVLSKLQGLWATIRPR
ncbi:MAG: capsular polysaccharide biosynthesis protein [Rhodobacteraceae bacterium]|nr:capsular polysaccharide biosynthesis protein [Alphaproteobacteria bacterium]NNK66537.1 capsular polysaccharide biosynthesis protein [Paracoccaceae bacterium]